jgi:deoxyadenosine/deoxycytidine kinase
MAVRLNKEKRIIRIIGNIGAGKTTLLDELTDHIIEKFSIISEPVSENPILPLFYENQKFWSANMQSFMEVFYYQKLTEVKEKLIFTDYGLTKVFTEVLRKQNFLDENQYRAIDAFISVYHSCFDTLYIYLDTPPEVCHERIQKRGRHCEQGIELSYLEDLHEEYSRFANDKSNQVLFVDHELSTHDIVESIIDSAQFQNFIS